MEFAPFRLAAFVVSLAVFPAKASGIPRLALSAALFLLCLPLIAGAGSIGGPAGIVIWFSKSAYLGRGPSAGGIYTELAVGTVLGVLLSLGAQAVALSAAWFGALMFPSFSRRLSSFKGGLYQQQIGRTRIELMLSIVFFVSIIESGTLERIILLILASFKSLPPGTGFLPLADWRELLLEFGNAAILVSLCMNAPLFFLHLFSEIAAVVMRKLVPGSFSIGFVEALRVPLVLLLFGLTFSIFTSQLQLFQNVTLDRLESVKQGP